MASEPPEPLGPVELGLDRRLLVGVLSIVILAALVYRDDLISWAREASFDLTSYLLFLPFAVAYSIVKGRQTLAFLVRFSQPSIVSQIVSISLIISSILVYFYGSYSPLLLQLHLISMLLFLISGILLFFGKTLLRSLVPIFVYLTLMIPPPVDILYGVGTGLGSLSYSTIHELVSLTGLPVTFVGGPDYGVSLVSAAGQSVQLSVAVQCSGIYSLLGFGAVAAFLLLEQRDHMIGKLTCLALGVPILYSLNVIRVTTIILMAYQWGEGVAVDAFHFVGGFLLAMTGTFIALRLGSIISRTHNSTQAPSEFPGSHLHPASPAFCSRCPRNMTIPLPRRGKPYAAGALAVGALLILTLSLPVMTVTNHGVAQVIYSARGVESSPIFPNSGGWTPYFVSRDVQYERLVGEDGAYWYRFVRVNAGSTVDVFALLELSPTVYAHASAGLSNPSYMSTSGFTTVKIYPITISQAPPIVGWFSTMEPAGLSSPLMTVLTWSQRVSVEIEGNVAQRLVATSLIGFPSEFQNAGLIGDEQDYVSMAHELNTIAAWIISSWSVVESSPFLAQIHQALLSQSSGIVASVFFFLPFGLALQISRSQLKRRRLRNSFEGLSTEDRNFFMQLFPARDQSPNHESAVKSELTCNREDQERTARLRRLLAARIIEPEIKVGRDCVVCTWRPMLNDFRRLPLRRV